MPKKKNKRTKKLALTSLLLIIFALAAATAVSLAWLSISGSARLNQMGMDIVAGPEIRIALDAHDTFEEYFQSLNTKMIFERIEHDYLFDPVETPLEPVTTWDCGKFSLKNGVEADVYKGQFLTFTLHFRSTKDVDVYLTNRNTKGEEDGTLIASSLVDLPRSMRVGFTSEERTAVYSPHPSGKDPYDPDIVVFSLPNAKEDAVYEDNYLFQLPKDTDVPVLVHIWMEGTDKYCDNSLKGGDYSIQMRFVGVEDGIVPNE